MVKVINKRIKVKEIIKKQIVKEIKKQTLEEEVKSQDEKDTSIFRTSGFISTGLKASESQNAVQEIQESKRQTPQSAVTYAVNPTIQDLARKYEVNSLQSQRTQNSAILRPIFTQAENNNLLSNTDTRLQHQDIQTKYYEPGKLDDIKVKRRNPWDG